jgi:hypothetical protein
LPPFSAVTRFSPATIGSECALLIEKMDPLYAHFYIPLRWTHHETMDRHLTI